MNAPIVILLALNIILQSCLINCLEAENPIVATTFGSVRGTTGISRDGRTFYQFLGIPYAKAERFQAPQDPDSWTNIRDATKLGNLCVQIQIPFHDVLLGAEDCLNLNVHTPRMPSQAEAANLLPVLVWFPPGGGDSDPPYSNPVYYMDTNVILVTFNARLGFLGYLNLGIEQAAGNQRLKDEIAVLKWIQANIRNFGGDKDRVTLMGSENGGAEINFLIISPMAKGLFAGAISQGGVALTPSLFLRNPIYQAKFYGRRAGCTIDTKENLLQCLMGKNATDLLLDFHRSITSVTTEEFLKFGPSIETTDQDDAVLTESPYIAMKEGRIANKVPWLVTWCENQGATAVALKLGRQKSDQDNFNNNVQKILPWYLDYDITAKFPEEVTRKIQQFYFQDKEVNENNIFSMFELQTDRLVTMPIIFAQKLYAHLAPTYSLVLGYVPEFTVPHIFGLEFEVEGNPGDDFSYQFLGAPLFPGINATSKDYELSKNYVSLMAAFAENGKPTYFWGLKDWPAINFEENKNVTFWIDRFGYGSEYVISDYVSQRIAFWNDLFSNELTSEFENPPKEKF